MNPMFMRSGILQESGIWDRLKRKAGGRTRGKDGSAMLSLSGDGSG